MGWNPANWQITDILQGQNGAGGAGGGAGGGGGGTWTQSSFSAPTSSPSSGFPPDLFITDNTQYGQVGSNAVLGENWQGKQTTAPTAPTSTVNTAAQQAAAEKAKQDAQYQSQIDSINRMLGIYNPQRQTGLSQIDSNYNEQQRRLQEQQTQANSGYDEQKTQAEQGQARGYDQVDNYAYNSANGLNRIFQGANAGKSSVARLLAPHLVGQAADSRRLDVTNTANQNLSGIKRAKDQATSDFGYANQDLENNRGYAKDALEKGITQQEMDQYNQRMALEQQLGRDTSGTQNEINSRTARLQQLFGAGSYNPQYTARAVTPQAVSLNSYNVDPMQIKAGNTQAGGGFYAQQLKKKDELRVR